MQNLCKKLGFRLRHDTEESVAKAEIDLQQEGEWFVGPPFLSCLYPDLRFLFFFRRFFCLFRLGHRVSTSPELLVFKGMIAGQLFERDFTVEPDAAHGEDFRTEMDIVHVPDQDCQESERRLKAVHNAENLMHRQGENTD